MLLIVRHYRSSSLSLVLLFFFFFFSPQYHIVHQTSHSRVHSCISAVIANSTCIPLTLLVSSVHARSTQSNRRRGTNFDRRMFLHARTTTISLKNPRSTTACCRLGAKIACCEHVRFAAFAKLLLQSFTILRHPNKRTESLQHGTLHRRSRGEGTTVGGISF